MGGGKGIFYGNSLIHDGDGKLIWFGKGMANTKNHNNLGTMLVLSKLSMAPPNSLVSDNG